MIFESMYIEIFYLNIKKKETIANVDDIMEN